MKIDIVDSMKKKHAGGRPSKYTPQIGEDIVALMEQGFSLTAACAAVNVCNRNRHEWIIKHPEFADLIELGKAKRQLYLESMLVHSGHAPKITASIFALKNANPAEWNEKQIVEHQGNEPTIFGSVTFNIIDKRETKEGVTIDATPVVEAAIEDKSETS